MDVFCESEQLRRPIVGSRIGSQHIIPSPGIGSGSEHSHRSLSVVVKGIRLDEHRIGVHVDIFVKPEKLDLGVVTTHVTLDYLAILVPERATIPENGHTIFCVVVQVGGPEGILLLILKLDQRSAELSQAAADVIIEFVTRQGSVILKNAHMTDGLDNLPVNIPVGSVAEQFRGVMLETHIPDRPAETMPTHILLHQFIASQKSHEAIFVFPKLRMERYREKK